MNALTTPKTAADIAIILCLALFIILLIVGIAFVSVFTVGFSFIFGGIAYGIADYETIKELYKE